MQVCLASTSPARLMLLRQAGIEPLTLAPDVDEDAVIAGIEAETGRTLSPTEHVLVLARRKAADVAARIGAEHPGFDGIVIGGDSMFELDGVIYGKPHTPEAATARWHDDARAHGRAALRPQRLPRRSRAPRRSRRTTWPRHPSRFAADISDEEIDAYVASGEPLQVAGAFTIDSLGGPFIDSRARRPVDGGRDVAVDGAPARPRAGRLVAGLWNRLVGGVVACEVVDTRTRFRDDLVPTGQKRRLRPSVG